MQESCVSPLATSGPACEEPEDEKRRPPDYFNLIAETPIHRISGIIIGPQLASFVCVFVSLVCQQPVRRLC